MVKKKNATKVTLEKRYLYKLVKHTQVISDEFVMIIDEDKISTNVIDDSHVSTVDVELSNSCYDFYYGNKKEVGMKAKPLMKFLKTFGYDDIISFIIFEREDYDSKFVQLESTKNELFTLSNSFRLIDSNHINSVNNLDFEWPFKVKISNECLRTICEHGKGIDKNLRVIYDDNEFEFSVDKDENQSRMKVQNLKIFNDTDKVINCLLDLERLYEMSKAIYKKTDINIYMDNDYPVKIESTFDDVGKVKYKIAPRIESS